MNFLLISAILITVTIGQCNGLQCHDCQFQDIESLIQGQFGCQDPFRSSGIAQVQCSGTCYANLTRVEVLVDSELYSYEVVNRGCSADADVECEYFQGCQEVAGTRFCLYCCDDADGCNGRSFEEVDQSITKCWQCQAELTPDGLPVDPNHPCARSDFNGSSDGTSIGLDGEGPLILSLPCLSGTCMTFTIPASEDYPATITRTCAVEALLVICENPTFYEMFGGYKNIDCCTSSLCNIGSDFTPAVPTTVGGPDMHVTDAVIVPIYCWECNANITSDGSPVDGSTCGSSDLIGTRNDVFAGVCATGVCITVTSALDDIAFILSVTRTCAVDVLRDFCLYPELYKEIAGLANIECCEEDRCITGTTDSKPEKTTTAFSTAASSTTRAYTTMTTINDDDKEGVTQKADMTTNGASSRSTIIWIHTTLCYFTFIICLVTK